MEWLQNMANIDITKLIELTKQLAKLLKDRDLELNDNLDNREEENKRNEYK